MNLLVKDSRSIVTLEGTAPVRGAAFGDIEVRPGGSISCDEGRIVSVGRADTGTDAIFDAEGCTIIPGLVDCHTHLPFFGWRADEDAARLSGVRYEDIHGRSGGIFRSAALLAEASDEQVIAFSARLALQMLRSGTTTFETKSGYGLSVEAELRQLRLARKLADKVPQRVVTTCLAAHAIPEGKDQGQWIGEAANDLLPAAAAEGLCSAVDIYVESIAFALEHAARLAEAAKAAGLAMRVHADQLADNQTAAFATRWGFRSADHLNHSSLDAVDDLAASDTAAVLLPGATFTLRQAAKPPARALIEAGAIVALGTDLNPGTSPIASLPLAMALGCRLYSLSPMEALVGATVNAAYVLGLENEAGRIESGLAADLVILDAPSFEHLVYRPDADHIVAVIRDGDVAYLRPGSEPRLAR
ncbi:MAG: imidazolonepropionase [Actinomycetota bacterium]|jgi:imidazolonepropionase|nr:imidazolonepropionase [Actinomycetota bacterium]